MRTDGVVLGTLTDHGDHMHLEWVCPDCGSKGDKGAEIGPHRIVCDRTGREFLVVAFFFEPARICRRLTKSSGS